MKENRNATKAMSRIAVRFLGGALGVASLLPQHPRAHLAVEIVAMEQAPKRDRHQQERSEEHTSELQSLMRISYAVFCLKKKKTHSNQHHKYYKKQRPTTNRSHHKHTNHEQDM